MLLKYGIVYVSKTLDIEVRKLENILCVIPSFAALAIKHMLENKIKKGIIWLTKGSGKTTLAYITRTFLKPTPKLREELHNFSSLTV